MRKYFDNAYENFKCIFLKTQYFETVRATSSIVFLLKFFAESL